MPYVKNENIFGCPADYGFPIDLNPAVRGPLKNYDATAKNSYPFCYNVAGKKIAAINPVARVVLMCEHGAHWGYSWHEQKTDHTGYNNPFNPLGFVDGHVAYMATYCSGRMTYMENQAIPAIYDYQWISDDN